MQFEPRHRNLRWITRSVLIGSALLYVALILPTAAVAQDLDDLDDLDEGVVLEEVFEPGVEPSTWELTIVFGQMDLNHDLLVMEDIIVDIEEPGEVIFNDATIGGETSFAPHLRIGRTFGRHFALEASAGFAVGDFLQSVGDDELNLAGTESENVLTEEELEKGSYFSWDTEIAALWYPRGEGRVQPYLIGAFGRNFFELDSVYANGIAQSNVFSYGLGLRVVGDDLYSFRIEVRNYHRELGFDLGTTFATVPLPNNQGLVEIPLLRRERVTYAEFESQEYQDLLRALGFSIADVRDIYLEAWENQSGQATTPPAEFSLEYFRRAEPFEEQSFTTLWVSAGFTAAF